MTDDAAFLAAIAADPTDNLVRLVYADWFDERGDPRGAYLRAECEPEGRLSTTKRLKRLQILAEPHDPDWLATVARVPVTLCRVGFALQCPKRWESLTVTDKPTERACGHCQEIVHFCTTTAEADALTDQGRCVALNYSIASHSIAILLKAWQRAGRGDTTLERLPMIRPIPLNTESYSETERREIEAQADEGRASEHQDARTRRAYKRQSPGDNSATNPDAP